LIQKYIMLIAFQFI